MQGRMSKGAGTYLWRKITAELSSQIDSGGFKRGDTFMTLDEISSRYDVSRITSRRVMDELASSGYIEKGPGRLPSVKGSPGKGEILVLFSREENISSIIFAKIYEGVMEEASRRSCRVNAISPIYFKAKPDCSGTMIVIPQCIPQEPEFQALIESRTCRIVCAHALKPKMGGVSTVRPDLKKAAELVIAHLTGKGYGPIAYVGDKDGGQWISSRFETYYEAMQERNAFSLDYVKECSYRGADEGGVRKALDELLSLPEPPRAIFATNDMLALIILHILKERGLDVPGDIAISGFDNIPESALSSPALTTVDTKWKELGILSVRRLFEMAPGDIDDMVVKPELVARQSA